LDSREITIQSGAFGEHRIERVAMLDEKNEAGEWTDIGQNRLNIQLGPAASDRLKIEMKRL